MKNILIISLGFNFIFLIAILYASINGRHHVKKIFTEKLIKPRYDRKVSMFNACPTSPGAIIFLGNSITEGGNWSEIFENENILNRGIGGDISAGVLARIDEVIRHQPSKVFVCIGTNDLARGIKNSTIIANYETIIQSIRENSPETKIYVQSVLPVRKKVIFGHSNDEIKPLNEAILKMCHRMSITYIDLFSELSNEEDELIESYTNDNLHLMGHAYLEWKNILVKYINE